MPGITLSADEERLAKKWRDDEGLAPSAIALRLGRDKTTINRLFRRVRKKRGRHRLLTDVQVDALIAKLKDMIKISKGRWEVTAYMLKRRARCKASVRIIQERIHERGVWWFAMRLKPLLTDDDIEDRFSFGWTWVDKPLSFWSTHVHMHIDVKFFPVFCNAKGRRHAAQSGRRGVYRMAGEGLGEGYYKPNPKLKYNTGAKGVHVLAGVGQGQVLVWEYFEGRWNGAERSFGKICTCK